MKKISTSHPDVIILEPDIFSDSRGLFFEQSNDKTLSALLNRPIHFVQDNVSYSRRHVLRGLHLQWPQCQAKLIRVTKGEIFDVAVDVRPSSPHFGQHVTHIINDTTHQFLWLPEGFAHGFLAMSDDVQLSYKTTCYYAPAHEMTIRWNDPDINITWPITAPPVLSPKDRQGISLRDLLPLIKDSFS